LHKSLNNYLGFDLLENHQIINAIKSAQNYLVSNGINIKTIRDELVSSLVRRAEEIDLKKQAIITEIESSISY